MVARSPRSCAAASAARFTSDELAELYERGTDWCPQIATQVAPDEPWAWDRAVVVDAAFARYVRGAQDFAGGRREIDA